MNYEEIVNDFIKLLKPSRYTKDNFYDALMDYLEAKEIFCDEDEEHKIESLAYKKAVSLNLVGYVILFTVTDMTKFVQKMNKYIDKVGSHIFHFQLEPEDESLLSYTDIWEKWNNIPPQGWLAGWCKCGEFFPHTFDIGTMDIENDSLIKNNFYKPIKIDTDMVKQVNFCSDGYFRLLLKSGETFAVKTYTFDRAILINFADDPRVLFNLDE